MNMTRQPGDDLLDVARVLLLLQGAILLATTIEALIWGVAFGAAGFSVLLSAVAAMALLIARARVRPDRRGVRRIVYVVEGVVLVTLAVDTTLALLVTRGTPPALAIITRLVIPVAVIALLRRSERPLAAPTDAAVAAEGGS
jgi:hypothetical protein